MKRNSFKCYSSFIKGGILEQFAYKFSFFGWMTGDIIEVIIMCSLWTAVFKNSQTGVINGFELPLMLSYIVIGKVVGILVNCSSSFWIVSEDIREGNIAISLTKPINYRHRLFYQSIGSYIGCFIMFFIPLFVIAQLVLHFSISTPLPSVINTILCLISSFLAFVIVDCISFLIGELAFFTGALFGVLLMKNAIIAFLSGQMIPINFFPQIIQKILRILPFSSMVETPNYIALNIYTFPEALIKISIQLLWVIVLYLLSMLTFKKSVKHVVSVGG